MFVDAPGCPAAVQDRPAGYPRARPPTVAARDARMTRSWAGDGEAEQGASVVEGADLT